ncbi:MAG: intermembrane phospholipid transport protein YdbH family protein [Victivallaceae bacterium]
MAVALLLAIAGACFIAGNYYLPDYLRKNIFPKILREAGIKDFSGKVRHAGLFSADLGSLTIGDATASALKVHAVKIRYSPVSLLPGFPVKLNEVDLNGIYLHCSAVGDKLMINGIDLEIFSATIKERLFKPDGSAPALSIEKILISDAVLEVELREKKYLLPFELTLEPRSADWSLLNVALKVSWRGREISAGTLLNFAGKTADAEFSAQVALARGAELCEYLRIIKLPQNFKLDGDAAIKGRFSFEFSPFRINTFVLEGVSDDCTMKIDRLVFCNELNPDDSRQPVSFKFSKDKLKYLLSVSDFRSSFPLPLSFRGTKCEFVSTDDLIEFNGEMLLNPAKILSALDYKVNLLKESVIARRFNVSLSGKNGEWKLNSQPLSPATAENCEIFMKYEKMFIFASAAKINISGAGKGFAGEIGLGSVLADINVSGAGRTIAADSALFDSKMKLQCPDKGLAPKTSDIDLQIRIPSAIFAGSGWDFKLSELEFYGNCGYENGRVLPAKVVGRLVCGKVSGRAEDSRVDSENFSAKAELQNEKNTERYFGSGDLAFSRFDVALNGCGLNLRGSSLKSALSFEQRKSRRWELAGLSWNCTLDKIELADEAVKIAADKLECGGSLKFETGYFLNYKKVSGKLAHVNISAGEFSFESWESTLDGLFEYNQAMPAKSKKNLKEQLVFNKASLGNKLFNASASGRLTVEGLLRNSRLAPDSLESTLTLNSPCLNIGESRIKADELKVASKYFFDPKLSLPSALVRIENSLETSALQGRSGEMNFQAPGLAASMKFGTDSSASALRSFSGKAAVKDVSGVAWNSDFEFSNLILNWESRKDEEGIFTIHPVFKGVGFKVKGDLFNAEIPAVVMTGQYDGETFAGKVALSGASAGFPEQQIILKNIDLRMPVSLPDMKAAAAAELKVGSIIWQESDLGSTAMEIESGDAEAAFQGNYSGRLIPGSSVSYMGRIAFPLDPFKLEMEYAAPEFRIAPEFDLTKLSATFAGIAFHGLFSGKGNLKIDGSSVRSSAEIKIKDSQLRFPGTSIKGINFECVLDDLLNFRSAPHQAFNFKELKFGRYEFADGQGRMQFESLSDLLIENCRFKWLGGSVSNDDAFRLSADAHTGTVPISIKDIRLADMLRFCGFAQVEATGVLSGSMPLSWSNGRLAVDQASFYAIPGQGGVVRLPGLVSCRMPGIKDKELDNSRFAEAALEDFQYNWLKLSIDEEGETIFTGIQAQGKSQLPIPFKYESGKISPLSEGEKKAVEEDLVIQSKFSSFRSANNQAK